MTVLMRRVIAVTAAMTTRGRGVTGIHAPFQRYALGQVVIDAVERSFMERAPERASGWGGAIASRRLRKAWWPRPATGNRTMYLAIRQIVGGAGPARRTQIRGPASAIMY